MPRAPLRLVDIAIDKGFQPNDAFRATMAASSLPPPAPSSAPLSPHPASRTASRTVWWPLVLVGFFAVACATIAFLKSPLAHHPTVAPYANAVLAKLG